MHIDVEELGPGRWMGEDEAGLLDRLAEGRLRRSLARIDVPTGLHPPVETPVPVEDHAAPPDDDGRCGHMGRVLVLVEGVSQTLELVQHDGQRPRLALIPGPVGQEQATEIVGPAMAADGRGGRVVQADLRR